MELIEYVRIVRRRWIVVAVVLLGCLGGAAAVTLLTTPLYTSSARWLVVTNAPADLDAPSYSAITLADVAATFAPTEPVVSGAVEQAGLPAGTPVSVSSAVPSETTAFVDVSVTAESPTVAAQVATALPVSMVDSLVQLQQIGSPDDVRLETISAPGVPGSPSSPDVLRNLLIGLGVGLVLGLAAAFVREALDVRVRDVDEIEEANDLAVLAVVPDELRREAVPAITQPESARAEAYRKVRTHLLFADPAGMPSSVLVTSPNPGEGKTSLATNLAAVCQRAGQSVCVVDADLRRPMVAAHLLDGVHEPGLSDYLAGRAAATEIIDPSRPGLAVVPSGPVPSNPSELLGSRRMAELIEALEDAYDVVIVDAPPVLPVADAVQLAAVTRGTVLAARNADTSRTELRRAREALERVGGRILGIVLVGAARGDDSYGYKQYGYAYVQNRRRQRVPYTDAAEVVPLQPVEGRRVRGRFRRDERSGRTG